MDFVFLFESNDDNNIIISYLPARLSIYFVLPALAARYIVYRDARPIKWTPRTEFLGRPREYFLLPAVGGGTDLNGDPADVFIFLFNYLTANPPPSYSLI